MKTKALTNVTEKDVKLAKLAGFKRKKPNKPKGTLTESKYNSFVERYNGWAKDLKEKAKEGAKIEKEKDQLKKMKEKIKQV